VRNYKQRLAKYYTAQSIIKVPEVVENRRFADRVRFDQSKLWDWNRSIEEHSLIPSTWVALVEAVRKWGLPAGFRRYDWD
jgi:hypothetical protein